MRLAALGMGHERICGEMLELLRARGPWDGVLLAQHGAAVSEDYPDMDGEVFARVRAGVGPNVPIGSAPDMHANLVPEDDRQRRRDRRLPHEPAP